MFKIKSKKGTVLHWVVLGILLSAGLFLILQSDKRFESKVHGNWQLDFLENYYFEAEKDLVNLDLAAKQTVHEAILAAAKIGGFHKTIQCDRIREPTRDYVLWNEGKEWQKCLPPVEESIASRIEEKLGSGYSEIKVENTLITGKGKDKNFIVSKIKPFRKYSYDISFRVELDFDLKKDYDELQMEAVQLVGNCRKSQNLQECLVKNRKKDWKFKNCDTEEYVESKRRVFFCAESPQKAKVYSEGKLVPVRYFFALDFSQVE